MRLWTIQNEAILERAEKLGSLRADASHLFVAPEDGVLYECYCWIADQMKERIGLAPNGVHFPVWAWYQWRGESVKRPDMRCAGHAAKGERVVRITIDAPDDKVLLSNFDAYHCAFSGQYLPVDETDDQAFEEKCKRMGYQYSDLINKNIQTVPMQLLRMEIRLSWNRMFDIDRCDDHWLYGRAGEQSIQATMWEIPKSWVREVEHFIAR